MSVLSVMSHITHNMGICLRFCLSGLVFGLGLWLNSLSGKRRACQEGEGKAMAKKVSEPDRAASKAIAAAAAATLAGRADIAQAQAQAVREFAARAGTVTVESLKASIKAGDPDRVLGVAASFAQYAREVAACLDLPGAPAAFGSGGIASRVARACQAGLSTADLRRKVAAAAKSGTEWAKFAESLPKPAPRAKASESGESEGDEVLTIGLIESWLSARLAVGAPSESDGEAALRVAGLAKAWADLRK